MDGKAQKEIVVFGGGCFWCTEAVFDRLKGVISVIPGYAGGTTKNPTYKRDTRKLSASNMTLQRSCLAIYLRFSSRRMIQRH
jgi:peptide methionine sulfoxide reductase MsrA